MNWVETEVRSAGAYWSSGATWITVPTIVGDTEFPALCLQNNDYITFYEDGSRLKVEFNGSSGPAGWRYTKYSYQYEHSDHTMILRFDMHPDPSFERRHGTTCHVHVGENHIYDRIPTTEVDLADVLKSVSEYQSNRVVKYLASDGSAQTRKLRGRGRTGQRRSA